MAKFAEIKEFMLRQIESGAWPEHSRVPSENELAEQFSVSRMTARRALQELTEQGILYRTQGVGSFVAALKSQSSLLEIRNIADEVQSSGHAYRAKLLQLTELPCPTIVATALGLKRNEQVFFSLIVHYSDALPLQLEARYVNPKQVPLYTQQDFQEITPHLYLSQIAPLTEAEHIVEAIWPDDFTCQQLLLKKPEPCLRLTRRTFSRDGAVSLAYLTSPGSRYRLGGHLNFALPR
ncbi:MAG: histidine utilization repressor [Alishewanella aestuarii]